MIYYVYSHRADGYTERQYWFGTKREAEDFLRKGPEDEEETVYTVDTPKAKYEVVALLNWLTSER